MKKEVKKKVEKENDSSRSSDLLKRVRISYLVTSSLVIVFAVSYGYLEYYYINDPVLGKTANLTVKGGTHRVATPIIGGLYSYHIYPMMVIFILVGFGPFFDSVSFNILGRHERRKAAALGVANVISAMLIEDFTWFFYRWWLPLDNDPKKGLLMQASDWTTKSLGFLPVPHINPFGNLVIPYWYIISIVIAGIFYYYAFKRSKQKITAETSK
jgi:hypothetical protein